MARKPKALRKSPENVGAENTESEEEGDDWVGTLKLYLNQQLINYLIKKKPPQDKDMVKDFRTAFMLNTRKHKHGLKFTEG